MMTYKLQVKEKKKEITTREGKYKNKAPEVLHLYGAERMSAYPVMHLSV